MTCSDYRKTGVVPEFVGRKKDSYLERVFLGSYRIIKIRKEREE